jgi:hypothetical protein
MASHTYVEGDSDDRISSGVSVLGNSLAIRVVSGGAYDDGWYNDDNA